MYVRVEEEKGRLGWGLEKILEVQLRSMIEFTVSIGKTTCKPTSSGNRISFYSQVIKCMYACVVHFEPPICEGERERDSDERSLNEGGDRGRILGS